MPLTLHDAFVPTAKQILGGLGNLIDKAEAHCADTGVDPGELVGAKLAETMWPLPWHVRACWVHSGFAIGLYESGAFSPDFTDIPGDWDAMRAQVRDALARLDAISPDALEALADKPIDFVLGGKLPGFGGGVSFDDRSHEWSGRLMWREQGKAEFYLHAPAGNDYDPGTRFWWNTEGFQATFIPGRWHHIEMHYRLNTPGQFDGLMEGWPSTATPTLSDADKQQLESVMDTLPELVRDRLLSLGHRWEVPGLFTGRMTAIVSSLKSQVADDSATDTARAAAAKRWIALEDTTEVADSILNHINLLFEYNSQPQS